MIEHYLSLLNQYLQTHPYMDELITFIIALAESLPIIGTLIPGSVTMSVIGILIGRGLLPFGITLIWATLGAITGDTLGFWIGKFYNERLRYIWPFKKYPKWLTLGEKFFTQHGGKSILIGRFVGPARSSVPLIAGLLKMGWGRFFIAAVPSAILWALAYLLPGILIGAISLELPKGTTTKFIVVGLTIIILLWIVFWMIQQFFVLIVKAINHGVDQLWGWLSRHHSSRFVIRLITNHQDPKDHHQLTLCLLALVSFMGFLFISINVYYGGSLTLFNEPLFNFLQSINTQNASEFFTVMTLPGETRIIYTIGILVALGLAFKKQWRSSLFLFILMITTGIAIGFSKWLIHSTRPGGFSIIDLSYSYPSGHSAFTLSILGFITFLTAKQLSQKWQWIPYTLGSIIITLICFSRLYLGAHWLSDIVGSIFLGFTILLTFIVAYRRQSPKLFASWRDLLFLILVVALPWMFLGTLDFSRVEHRFVRAWPVQRVSIEEWWKDPTHYLPIYRLNRFGKAVQPFNLQWSDTLEHIEQQLSQQGWTLIQAKVSINVKNTLKRFTTQDHAPLLAQLYRHKPPVLFMIKKYPGQSNIVELRLWESGAELTDSSRPLWIGSVDYRIQSERLLALKKSLSITLTAGGGIADVIRDRADSDYKILQISYISFPERIKPLNWDGSILLLRSK